MGGYASFVIITVARLLATFSAEGTIQINFSQNLCNLNIALKEGCKKEAFLLGEGGGLWKCQSLLSFLLPKKGYFPFQFPISE